jgi:hypothetical protein
MESEDLLTLAKNEDLELTLGLEKIKGKKLP